MYRIGIYCNANTGGNRQVIETLSGCFSERKVEYYAPGKDLIWLPDSVRCYNDGDRLDYIFVFGGDGTILGAVDFARTSGASILGINMGRLGFLSDFSINECDKYLDNLFRGNFSTIDRMLLSARVFREGKVIYGGYALNDAVIYKGLVSRLIEIRFYCNGNFVLETRCDGMIAATPTGSTAYSLSAGGPILSPEMENFVVAPLCPHVLSVRPMVFPANLELKFKMSNIYNETMLQLDGRNVQLLKDNDKIVVKGSEEKVRFVTLTKKNFYQTLRKKLHMGKI